jgi:hypothetical protein
MIFLGHSVGSNPGWQGVLDGKGKIIKPGKGLRNFSYILSLGLTHGLLQRSDPFVQGLCRLQWYNTFRYP